MLHKPSCSRIGLLATLALAAITMVAACATAATTKGRVKGDTRAVTAAQSTPVKRLPPGTKMLFTDGKGAYYRDNWPRRALYYSDETGIRKLNPACWPGKEKKRARQLYTRLYRPDNGGPLIMLVLCEQATDWPLLFELSRVLQGDPTTMKVQAVSRIATTVFRSGEPVAEYDDFGVDFWRVRSTSHPGAARPVIYLDSIYAKRHLITMSGDQTIDVITFEPDFKTDYNKRFKIVSAIGSQTEPVIALEKTRSKEKGLLDFFTVRSDEKLDTLGRINLNHYFKNITWDDTYDYFVLNDNNGPSIIIARGVEGGVEVLAVDLIKGKPVNPVTTQLNLGRPIGSYVIVIADKKLVFSNYIETTSGDKEITYTCLEIDKTPEQGVVFSDCVPPDGLPYPRPTRRAKW